jgi:hypothetical protein
VSDPFPFTARALRRLADSTAAEGKRLARRVKRGQLTRAEVEAAAAMFPNDAEPQIALAWLHRWGIR